MKRYDVAIIGAGPAGLTAASALGARGLAVVVIADGVVKPWTNSYGVWRDELENADLVDAAARIWPTTEVGLTTSERVNLDRGYARIDNSRLQHILRGATSADFVDARVERVEHDDAGTSVHARGATWRATVVVDAAGPGSALTHGATAPTAWQMAYGLRIRVDGHPFPLDRMQLMDWSDDHLAGDSTRSTLPTFLYAMPFGSDELFVEETSLVASPPVPLAVLRARLLDRLAHLGITVREVIEVERCRIPMDPGVPRLDQRAVAFGASSSFVHPATGYVLGRTLRAAPALADAIAAAIDDGPVPAARAGWQALWPASHRNNRALFALGSAVLRDLDRDRLRSFFRSFFSLPADRWVGFLAGDVPTSAVAAAMVDVFLTVDPGLRWTLIRAATGRRTVPILRSIAGLYGEIRCRSIPASTQRFPRLRPPTIPQPWSPS